MKGLFSEMRKRLLGEETTPMGDIEDEYVELDTSAQEAGKSKVTVRPYAIAEFADVKGILDALRDGRTIALVNIKPLKDKDLVELKRAINKLKKTCDAIEGDIAG
ncbi:MAG: cell division protein SepF, partial [Nanoarchaeota archaeon]